LLEKRNFAIYVLQANLCANRESINKRMNSAN